MPTPLDTQSEDRKRPGVEREYRTERIVVFWEPKLCIHDGHCLRTLPRVFDIHRRPWIKADAAGPDEVGEAIQGCPTGALSFARLDGAPAEPEPDTTTIQARPDGPLYVRGKLRVIGENGAVIRAGTRMALCRCGYSANKPFCDSSHVLSGFRSQDSAT
jgi:uncharacterized Fe-S cluster protein YjdI/CDGSH-type Zn-finger protein